MYKNLLEIFYVPPLSGSAGSSIRRTRRLLRYRSDAKINWDYSSHVDDAYSVDGTMMMHVIEYEQEPT